MIDYIFRDKKGMEIKRTVPELLKESKARKMLGVKPSHTMRVVNYGVTDKDLKAR